MNESEKHPPAAADSAGHLSSMPTGGGGETWISSMDMHVHCAERVWYLLGCLAAQLQWQGSFSHGWNRRKLASQGSETHAVYPRIYEFNLKQRLLIGWSILNVRPPLTSKLTLFVRALFVRALFEQALFEQAT